MAKAFEVATADQPIKIVPVPLTLKSVFLPVIMDQQEINQQKNSRLSLVLIALNTLLVLSLGVTGNFSEDESALNLLLAGIMATMLLGIFAFSYRGKAYRFGKWLFGIMLLLTLAYAALIWYAFQLGKAFQH